MVQEAGLDIVIDPLSAIPIYEQIHDQVVRGIALGRMSRGDRLATVRSLASALGINAATVSRAYAQLRSEGLIATNAKSHSVIIRDRDGGMPSQAFVEDWTNRLSIVLAEGRAQGLSQSQLTAICGQLVGTMGPHQTTQSHQGDAA